MKPHLSVCIALTIAITAASAFGAAKPKSVPAKPVKAAAKSSLTPQQNQKLSIILAQLKSLDEATQASLTKDAYKAKVGAVRTATLLPFFDMPPKNGVVIHARNAYQAYQDALSAWEEDPPYQDWDTIQDGPYVTTGIVAQYKIPVDFTDEKHKDLDVYDMEDYAHKLINTFLWKYAHNEYMKASAGAK